MMQNICNLNSQRGRWKVASDCEVLITFRFTPSIDTSNCPHSLRVKFNLNFEKRLAEDLDSVGPRIPTLIKACKSIINLR
jgi:hypothetical protein